MFPTITDACEPVSRPRRRHHRRAQIDRRPFLRPKLDDKWPGALATSEGSSMCFAPNGCKVSKKRSVFRNFLSQPARSDSNEGELHASVLARKCVRCNGF